MHKIAVLALPGVVPFDLSIPCEVFNRLTIPERGDAYEVRVCAETVDVKAGAVDLRVRWDLGYVADADTVIVPGLAEPLAPVSETALAALRSAAAGGARVASICTGAFVLAAAGLLDGVRATTHWLAAPALAARYPTVTVDRDVLFVDNGNILTSAGAAAGLDMCLHLVRRDYGSAMAARAARFAVMPLEREGGQAQYIVHEPPSSSESLAPVLRWLQENLASALTLEQIAGRAAMSTRTLTRHFRAQTGTSPARWVLGARIRRAQELLETTRLSVDEIASAAGFASPAAFRERFAARAGTSPTNYRRAFGGG